MADIANDDSFGSFHRFDENMDIEPIPSSVHPEDDDAMGHGHDASGIDTRYLMRLFAGFALACALAGGLLGLGVALGWNSGPLRPLYAPFGLAPAPSHESALMLEDIVAKMGADAAGQPGLQVTGTIRNTGTGRESVPTLEITVLSEIGAEGDSVHVKSDKDSLDAGEDVAFTAVVPGDADPKDRIRLRFIPE